MRKLALVCSLLLITIGLAFRTSAQESAKAPESVKAQEPAKPVHYYRLEFVIEELNSDGKPVNSRTFSTSVSTEPRSYTQIRTGSKYPIATSSKSTETNSTAQSAAETQFQYVDLGVNVDVHNVHEVESQLAFDLGTEFSSVATPSSPNVHMPVIRTNRWQASLLIPIGKSIVAFTSDSLESKGGTRVLVTATPIPIQ
jgi:hypothetical protein